MTLNPPLRNGCVNSALKVAVADLKELVPPQDASDGNFVFREDREDLPRCMLIRTHGSSLDVAESEKQYPASDAVKTTPEFIPHLLSCEFLKRGASNPRWQVFGVVIGIAHWNLRYFCGVWRR
jgi:hypothetical protein